MSTTFRSGGKTGIVEEITGGPLPMLRCLGWFPDAAFPTSRLSLESGRTLAPFEVSRSRRLDLSLAGLSPYRFCGFRIDFHLDRPDPPRRIRIGETDVDVPANAGFATVVPHYHTLFYADKVQHREDIYGYGPPTDSSEEMLDFAGLASGRILDFGCGNGSAVRYLRSQGKDAVGLELDSDRIRQSLGTDALGFVRLYSGGVPLPCRDGEFDSVYTSEVIEHVPEIEKYIPEFQRILAPGGKLLATTPDISCIPSSFPTGTVPWHLLESTHINLFTVRSIRAAFGPWFNFDGFFSFGHNRVNGHYIPGSLGFIATRK